MLRGVRRQDAPAFLYHCRCTAGGGAPAAYDQPRPAGQGRIYPLAAIFGLFTGAEKSQMYLAWPWKQSATIHPIALYHRWVPVAGSDRPLCSVGAWTPACIAAAEIA